MIPTPPPFFLFTTFRPRDPAVHHILERYFGARDYISTSLARADLALATQVDRTHRYRLCDSIAEIDDNVMAATTIFYDIEHWPSTPTAEQASPVASIAAGAREVHAEPDRKYGIAPDGEFIGLTPGACSFDFQKGILPKIDWTQIDFVNLQVQRLLSDSCADSVTVKDYVAFVSEATGFIRAHNPKIVVTAQLSFRYTPPDKMIAAVKGLTGVVDGFYLAFPGNSPVHASYCTAADLERMLAGVRPAHG